MSWLANYTPLNGLCFKPFSLVGTLSIASLSKPSRGGRKAQPATTTTRAAQSKSSPRGQRLCYPSERSPSELEHANPPRRAQNLSSAVGTRSTASHVFPL